MCGICNAATNTHYKGFITCNQGVKRAFIAFLEGFTVCLCMTMNIHSMCVSISMCVCTVHLCLFIIL